MTSFFQRQREYIFQDVQILVYVFDIESQDIRKDVEYFQNALEALGAISPQAKVFCLLHKMDRIPADAREKAFRYREAELLRVAADMPLACFPTSIWDESLYRAWSAIAASFVPHPNTLARHLDVFCRNCDADEVVLFEQSTLLTIAHVSRRERPDADRERFSKISNILTQFRSSCARNRRAAPQAIEIRSSTFTAFAECFTTSTAILVVLSNPAIQPAVTLLNIQVARNHFERLFQAWSPAGPADPATPSPAAPAVPSQAPPATPGQAAASGGSGPGRGAAAALPAGGPGGSMGPPAPPHDMRSALRSAAGTSIA
ncbi:putative Ras-related GTP-binding protein A [Paratrimastix pyriformis]|uniref:Ras-related GTP-binding protein A n=1 Tax=Paratrimastix pyriformis TaxID=342808 RepID=A0ABQ8UUA6_9EUKA|nr:putative Ras-related GTP-binding protein A [Paratrimastix pyriformis]